MLKTDLSACIRQNKNKTADPVSGNRNAAAGNLARDSNMDGSNNTAVGNGTKANISNKVRIGNKNVTVIEGRAGLSVASDRRCKENRGPVPPGPDFIRQLEPVEYLKK